jgi:hypothetical protein
MLKIHDTNVKAKNNNGGVVMERIPYGKYTKEFREEAVRLVVEGGLSIPEAGRRLSVAPSTIKNWVRAYDKGKLSDDSRHNLPVAENLLGQNFKAAGPNRIWVSDITYIST